MKGIEAGELHSCFCAEGMGDMARLHAFVAEAFSADDSCDWADVKLAVEEVFTNIYTHGYRALVGKVDVRLSQSACRVELEISDEAPQFDPATAPRPDLGADLTERQIGGLGWHLVRQVMDEVSWAPREGGGNTYRLVKLTGEHTFSIDT